MARCEGKFCHQKGGGGVRYYKHVDCNTTGLSASVESEGEAAQTMGFRVMNEEAIDRADAEDLTSDVSDEALEAAIKNEAQPAWTTVCTGVGCPG
jgi:hypothetical protein